MDNLIYTEQPGKYRGVCKSLEEIYPERWQIDTSLDEVIVKFPEVTITDMNSRVKPRPTHTIYDLYVKIGLHGQGFQGTRGILTYPEWCSSYSHSHLHSNSSKRGFSSFCLGNASIVTNLAELARFPRTTQVRNSENYINAFEIVLFETATIIELESGSPYRSLTTIHAEQSSSDNFISPEMQQEALKKFIASGYLPTITLAGNDINIIVDNQMEALLVQCTNCHQFKDEHGHFYTDVQSPGQQAKFLKENNGINPSFNTFSFRGESITQKVLGFEELFNTKEDKRIKYADRQIVKYIVNEIETRLKREYLSTAILDYYKQRDREREVQVHHEPSGLPESLVPVLSASV